MIKVHGVEFLEECTFIHRFQLRFTAFQVYIQCLILKENPDLMWVDHKSGLNGPRIILMRILFDLYLHPMEEIEKTIRQY